MRILFADDQTEIRLLTAQQLEKKGHRVVAVENGVEALRAFERQPFDIVLLDEEMPGLTGTEVLAAIRAGESQGAHSVVIALTGHNSEADKDRLVAAGFDSVLGKPFHMDMLESILAVFNRSETDSDAPVNPPSITTRSSEIDLLTRVGGDEQLLRRMARTFLQDLPPRLAKLQKSIQQKRADDLVLLAHAFKGTLGIFGAEKAAALCKELQGLAQNKGFSAAGKTFTALKEAVAELEVHLRGYAGQKNTAGSQPRPRPKSNRRNPESKRKTP